MSELNWWTMMSKHWGKVLGGLLGLIFAILVITLSFWWAVFIFFCVAIGVFVGWRMDLSDGLRSVLERLFRNREDY
ncbi:MAG: DUF2273 domain-containing protein [Bacillota bacterium]